MGKDIIRTDNLMKTYTGGTVALDDVNISIKDGDWASIIGPSGSGKTTLLNMIGCLDKPTGGSITVDGVETRKLDRRQLTRFRRDTIGLIFQQYHLVPYLTALENVMIAQYFHSIVEEEGAREALKMVGLGHRLDHVPSHLSGGEQQRVCIARALINEPRIILADEPTGNLDQKNGEVVLDLISDLHEQGHTIILVTHNPDIARIGNRIVKIIDGKVTTEDN